MGKGTAVVDYQACMACGVCVVACPFSYLALSKTDIDAQQNSYPALVEDHQCTGCGLCAQACPMDSISIHA